MLPSAGVLNSEAIRRQQCFEFNSARTEIDKKLKAAESHFNDQRTKLQSTLKEAETNTPARPLPRKLVPVMSVPMKLPWMRLS